MPAGESKLPGHVSQRHRVHHSRPHRLQSSLLSPRREEEGWSDAGRRASRGVGTPDLVSASAWGGGGNSSGWQVSRPDPALAAGPRDVEALVATESRRRVAEARALARRRLEDRMAALVGSLGSVAVLPGDEEQRTEIDALVRELEALTPIWRPMGGGSRYDWARSSELRGVATGPGPRPELDGVWRLVYASDGTYVTRSPPAQALRALSALPLGFGVRDIRQKLRVDAREGVVRAANIAVIGLGPGGEWKVAVRGTWAPQGDGIVADVAFDELSVRPVSILGRAVDGREEARERAGGGGGLAWGGGELGGGMSLSLAELRVPLPSDSQSAAQWQTTFLGDRYRVGRGRSANLFVFERLRDLDPALDATVFS